MSKWFLSKEHAYIVPFVVGITVLALLWLLFFAHNSVLNWVRASVEVASQEREMERLRSEIEQMDRQIHLLSHDRDSLESFARENYHFSAPDEDVYIVE